jgi:glycosyltransferase involved in cell wall biosynthesis
MEKLITIITKESIGVVIPVYNEERTIGFIVKKVLIRPEVTELVLVNDGSTDSTSKTIQELAIQDRRIRVFTHDVNQGKGAALRTAFKHVHSEIIIIQDADLEYDPDDYPRLLQPILADAAHCKGNPTSPEKS